MKALPLLIRRFIRNLFFSLILILLGAYIALAAMLYFSQPQLLYLPLNREMVATPAEAGLAFKDVFFLTADGIKINGWFIPAENAKGTVLFCHGNAGNISHRLDSIEIFNRLELNTFIFDYRGYGRSDGKPTEKGTYLDAEAAWDYLIRVLKIPPREIIIFGRSLGGAVAGWLAQQHRPRALIVESGFLSVPDIAARYYPYLPVRILSRFDYPLQKYLNQIDCPVLIIHSPDDEIIPFAQGQRLFQAAKDPKEFLQIYGSHNDGFLIAKERYLDGLKAFLSKY